MKFGLDLDKHSLDRLFSLFPKVMGRDVRRCSRHGGDAADTMNLYGFACTSREIVTKGERRVDEVDGAAIVELGVGVGLLRVGVGID